MEATVMVIVTGDNTVQETMVQETARGEGSGIQIRNMVIGGSKRCSGSQQKKGCYTHATKPYKRCIQVKNSPFF